MNTIKNVRVLCFHTIGTGGASTLGPQEFIALYRKYSEELHYEKAWEKYRGDHHYQDQHEFMYRQRFFREWGDHCKFTVLRDKVTRELIFCFALEHKDTDVYMFSLYARMACMRNRQEVQTDDGQLEEVVLAIANADASKEQFDWIGYGHFWLEYGGSDLGSHDRLGMDFSSDHIHNEGCPYWHEALADAVRQQLAEYFGAYVCFTMSLMRQSWPVRWDEEKAAAAKADPGDGILLDY
ncbi:MAG: hypothetical protein AAB400_02105 [Patescibacteria group bacterium]